MEKDIEARLLKTLSSDLNYSYREDIRDRASLEQNFRHRFEELNKVKLLDSEFEQLMNEITTSNVYEASKRLREISHFEREDGSPLDYRLMNTKDWCKNSYEVVNQLRMNTSYSHHVYDVCLLINGLPLVQIELKAGRVSPRKAMQQIVDYKHDPGNGYGNTILCFIQLFIVSNSTDTWYFANNEKKHFSFTAEERFLPYYRFADRENTKIINLQNFAQEFLNKCQLGKMLSRYMVLVASEQRLLVMRPYQMYAVQAIMDCIEQNCGNGYVWHTTGSGKTLTSFKASTLMKENPAIAKCLFVVDRKDLDRQTREEFNRFQEGCVEENTNTRTLVRRLLSNDFADKVIVTTIQKLGLALDENAKSPGGKKRNYTKRLETLRDKRVVFIFDECHRSQFGENHRAIKEFFPKSQLFGFTGTPIFEENAVAIKIEGDTASKKTTKDIFEHQLHRYTISHAIEDENVLRFHIDYFEPQGGSPVNSNTEQGKRAIIDAILQKHDASTANRKFNALFATSGIRSAIAYYQLFKEVQKNRQEVWKAEDGDYRPINIACVFSPPAEGKNKLDIQQIQEDLPQERMDNAEEPQKKKQALQDIIADYNQQFGTNHSIDDFDSYYQDIQKRIKDHRYPNSEYPHSKKIDITIVVDMLLTGFDSKYLNTLYVDKNLKHHGIIQAFSRTNRVLSNSKPYGQICDFRGQKDRVDEAIVLFSGEDAEKAKEIWLVDPAPTMLISYSDAVGELEQFMQRKGLECKPEDLPNLQGDIARITFVDLFKDIQRIRIQLDQYTDLSQEQRQTIEALLPKEVAEGFKVGYLEIARKLSDKLSDFYPKPEDGDTETIQEPDFEYHLFASDLIDYDYIMQLLAKFTSGESSKQKLTREELVRLIDADSKFLNERETLRDYIYSLSNEDHKTEDEVKEGYVQFKAQKQSDAIRALANEHGLDTEALGRFFDGMAERLLVDEEEFTKLIEPLSLGWKARFAKKKAIAQALHPLLQQLVPGQVISGLGVYVQG